MQTAPRCALRASSAKSARATRLSREYSVCMCMSSRMRSIVASVRQFACPRAKSGSDVLLFGTAEREDLDDSLHVVGPPSLEGGVAHEEDRPRGSARLE